jgi:hypothetical protein
MTTQPNNEKKSSKALDGFSESGDMYWNMIQNGGKMLQHPNQDAFAKEMETLEEGSESDQGTGILSAEVAPVMDGGAAIGQMASAGSSTGSSGNSSSSGDSDEDSAVENPVLASLTRPQAAKPTGQTTGTGGNHGNYKSTGQSTGRRDDNGHHQKQNNHYEDNENNGTQRSRTSQEIKMAKFAILAKLNDLQNRGVTLSQEYNMNSDLETMEREYNIHFSIRNKQVIVGMYDQGFTGGINIIEFANHNYDPFGFKLDGVSKAVNAERDEYRDIWGDFYEMYHKDDKMIHPVVRLGFALSNTLSSHHINNSRTESAEAEKARINKQISDQVKLQMAAMNLNNSQQKIAGNPGRPSYDDLLKENAELGKRVASLSNSSNKILEKLSLYDRQNTAANQPINPPTATPPPKNNHLDANFSRFTAPTADSRRLDNFLANASLDETRNRHSSIMREQDKIIGNSSGRHNKRRESTEEQSETEETVTDSPEPEEERRSTRSKHNKRVSSSESDTSSSTSSSARNKSARSSNTGNSRGSKGRKRTAKIDTEQIR